MFGAFTLLRHRAHVVVVFQSKVQEALGISAATRQAETTAALKVLGLEHWEQWPFNDLDPDWSLVEVFLRGWAKVIQPELVFAPFPEEGGHEQHNQLGELAAECFPEVTHYLTYTEQGKSEWGIPVDYRSEWVPLKLAALACYRSQAADPGCHPHFLRDQSEYYAP